MQVKWRPSTSRSAGTTASKGPATHSYGKGELDVLMSVDPVEGYERANQRR